MKDYPAFLRKEADDAESEGMPDAAEALRAAADEMARLQERLAKLEGNDDHPENRCERCGGRNVVWHAANDLWNRVTNGEYSILCPICFCELADERFGDTTSWNVVVADGTGPLQAIAQPFGNPE